MFLLIESPSLTPSHTPSLSQIGGSFYTRQCHKISQNKYAMHTHIHTLSLSLSLSELKSTHRRDTHSINLNHIIVHTNNLMHWTQLSWSKRRMPMHRLLAAQECKAGVIVPTPLKWLSYCTKQPQACTNHPVLIHAFLAKHILETCRHNLAT